MNYFVNSWHLQVFAFIMTEEAIINNYEDVNNIINGK